jgi:hypothetical protein
LIGTRPAVDHRLSIDSGAMDNDLVKRLLWSGMLAGVGALSSILAQRVAVMMWRRLFDEEPPE